MISRIVLVAPEPFGEIGAARVAAAIGRGLAAGDRSLEVDLLPVELPGRSLGTPADLAEALVTWRFEARMRAARAVILGAARLDEDTLLGSATFELATRARQAGVPAYAVAGEDALSLFDARILDLQVVLQAPNVRALRRAGERLAGFV